jgi:hypothetical protein
MRDLPRLDLVPRVLKNGQRFRLWQDYKEGLRALDYKILATVGDVIVCACFDHLSRQEDISTFHVRHGEVFLHEGYFTTYAEAQKSRRDKLREKISVLKLQIKHLKEQAEKWPESDFVGMLYPFE